MVLKNLAILVLVLALGSCGEHPASEDPVRVEFRLAETEPGSEWMEMVLFEDGQRFYLHEEIIISNEDVAAARVESGPEGRPQVGLLIHEEGAARVARVTADNIGKRVAILVEGKLVSAPIIRDTIPGGRVIINGRFSREEAERIAAGIGAKP